MKTQPKRSALPPAPGPPTDPDGPIELAENYASVAAEVNNQLRRLRYRLFGDEIDRADLLRRLAQQPPGSEAPAPKPNRPLYSCILSIGTELSESIEQLSAIHDRL